MTPSDASYQPVKVLQEDSFWYIIPVTKYEKWLELKNWINTATTRDQEYHLIS